MKERAQQGTERCAIQMLSTLSTAHNHSMHTRKKNRRRTAAVTARRPTHAHMMRVHAKCDQGPTHPIILEESHTCCIKLAGGMITGTPTVPGQVAE